MSTADDDDEKTMSGPPTPGGARGVRDDAETGLQAERRRGRAASRSQATPCRLGTRLRDYEITGLIGEGGFGIVYLAWDHSLQRQVAIKEYMPASMAARVNGSSAIVVKSERHLDTFRAGLKSFVNEARLLARFDHPSLVKVYRFWEENGTAYMVMPYYEGPTLKAALAELGRAPSEAELRAWLGRSSTRSPSCTRRSATTATSRPTTSCCTPRGAAAARLRRGAPRHRRHDARDHGRPQARLSRRSSSTATSRRWRRARGPTCTRSPASSTTRSPARRRRRRSSG